MATYKQRTANRANAQKSRGPKSEEGKSVARMNAYRARVDGQDPGVRRRGSQGVRRVARPTRSGVQPPPWLGVRSRRTSRGLHLDTSNYRDFGVMAGAGGLARRDGSADSAVSVFPAHDRAAGFEA